MERKTTLRILSDRMVVFLCELTARNGTKYNASGLLDQAESGK